MSSYRPRVYTASILGEYRLWQTFAEDPDWAFCKFTASWPYKAQLEWEASEPPPQELLREAWQTNIREILDSDFLLLYGRLARIPPLRGALVEAGVALGNNIKIIAVGLDLEHTWAQHHLVVHVNSLRDARDYLQRYTVMAPPRSRRTESENRNIERDD